MKISINTARELFRDVANNDRGVSLVACNHFLTKKPSEPLAAFARLMPYLTAEDGTLGRIKTVEAFQQLDNALYNLAFNNQGIAFLCITADDKLKISIFSSIYDDVQMIFTFFPLSE